VPDSEVNGLFDHLVDTQQKRRWHGHSKLPLGICQMSVVGEFEGNMLSLNDICVCEKARTMEFKISNLCDRPEFFDAVADRMWRAWWQPKGHSLSQVFGGLTNMLKDGNPFPFGLFAHKRSRGSRAATIQA
jgi:hypothetical protein